MSLLELAIAIVAIGLVIALAFPLIQSAREGARRRSCRQYLSRLVTGMLNYHDSHQTLPPAAVWSPNETVSLALHISKQFDRFAYANWSQLILPYTGEEQLWRRIDLSRPIASPENEAVRMTSLAGMTCPSDDYNRDDNPYELEVHPGRSIAFARGNYAINAGTHCYLTGPGSTSSPNGDFAHLVMNPDPREFRLWGNGVAGFNVSFALDDMANRGSTLVAIEEVRAGIHPADIRGTWALGQIAASATWGHGVNGDDRGPNNQWERADDIIDCRRLHETLGPETLLRERMPCVHYVDANQNATARSQHPGGVNVAFMDESARFIADGIDPGLWHVIHSRETPPDTLTGFDDRVAVRNAEATAPRSPFASNESREPTQTLNVPAFSDGTSLINSLGMKFVLIPAGEFTMGVPDVGNSASVPDCPAHLVRLTKPLLLGMHEVTRRQYRSVMGADPASTADQQDPETTGEDWPIVDVTWHDAVIFCERLAERANEKSAGRTYRLPTEAEWEYACRSGSSEPYIWSSRRKSEDVSGEAAGISPPLPLTPVGSYAPNAFGVFDMRGNAWEWTADWFERDFYTRAPVEDPQGPTQGYLKVVRGGDWRFVGETCHIDYPILPPWKSNPFVGFRVACELTSR